MTDKTSSATDAAREQAARAAFEALPDDIKPWTHYMGRVVQVELRHPVTALTCSKVVKRAGGPQGLPEGALDEAGEPIGYVDGLVGVLGLSPCKTRVCLVVEQYTDPDDATVVAYHIHPSDIATVAEVLRADERHVEIVGDAAVAADETPRIVKP